MLKRLWTWLYGKLPCGHKWCRESRLQRCATGGRVHVLQCIKCGTWTDCNCEMCRRPWGDW